jgi:hypothetical protein
MSFRRKLCKTGTEQGGEMWKKKAKGIITGKLKVSGYKMSANGEKYEGIRCW